MKNTLNKWATHVKEKLARVKINSYNNNKLLRTAAYNNII